ncbi:MAG: hypothetical protein WCQ99_12455, partial [Pseudomonadota bacterium]
MLSLLYPRIIQAKNRIKYRGKRTYSKALLLLTFGMLFWSGIFLVFYRVLFYFKGIDIIGN